MTSSGRGGTNSKCDEQWVKSGYASQELGLTGLIYHREPCWPLVSIQNVKEMSRCPTIIMSWDNLLALLKQHSSSNNKESNNIRQLAQIFAQTITTGFIHKTLTWNSVMRAYSKSPTPIKATLIYNHFIRNSSISPDNHTYPALLKACARLLSLPKGKEIHAHVTKLGLLHSDDTFIHNSLIHFYGCLSQLKDARQLFDEVTDRDLVSWNSILGTYSASSSPGFCVEAMVLFKEMLCVGFQPDRITLIILLSACSLVEEEGLLYGRVIHAYGMKSGIQCGLGLENALLGLYSEGGGDMNAALTLFLEMVNGRRDVASYTIMINGYVESGLINQAKKIFDQMIVKDDVVSWNSMINGYVKAKRPEEAFELFAKMEMHDVNPDEKTIVSLLSACASLSDLRLGRSVHQFILQRSIKNDVFVGTALINMYAKCGSLQEAMATFYKLEFKDVFTWTTAITALANFGHGKEALALFSEMEKQGIKPNEATFVSVLTACSQSGLVEEGRRLFDSMAVVGGRHDIKLRAEHFGCLIDLYSRAGLSHDAEKLIRTMPVNERIVAYKTLLGGCISYINIDLGENVANELIKLGPHNHGVYILLSNFYALANQWDKVAEMRKRIKDLDMRKEVGMSCFIEVKNLLDPS